MSMASTKGYSDASTVQSPLSPLTSELIKSRLEAAGARYFSNDNISEFVKRGELKKLQSEVEKAYAGVLKALVIDTQHDHNSKETAKRVAKMFMTEVFAGRYQPRPHMKVFPNDKKLNCLSVVGPITVRSSCSHHMVPIVGECWIGVLPSPTGKVPGLSKFNRLVEWVMSRPQIQEESIVDLANILEDLLQAEAVGVIINATHYCVKWRGVKDQSRFITSELRGSFLTSDSLRAEFMRLIQLNGGSN